MSIELYRDLAQWLFDRYEEGQPRQVVEQLLLDQGYSDQQVSELTDLAYRKTNQLRDRLDSFDHYAEQQSIERRKQPFAVCAPLVIDPGRNTIDADHGAARISFRSTRPYVVVLDHFLTDGECDDLIALAENRLTRALVVDRKTGGDFLDDRRTSENLILEVYQDALCRRIEDRIAKITGVPVEHGESLQIMRYGVGAEYQPHQDFFSADINGEAVHFQNGGNRVATLVMYLNDVESGGSTIFPHAGLEVFPQKGSAVYFAYTDEDGRNDELAFHGGSPVIAGEKWIASKWLREKPTPWGQLGLERHGPTAIQASDPSGSTPVESKPVNSKPVAEKAATKRVRKKALRKTDKPSDPKQ